MLKKEITEQGDVMDCSRHFQGIKVFFGSAKESNEWIYEWLLKGGELSQKKKPQNVKMIDHGSTEKEPFYVRFVEASSPSLA